MMYYPSAFEKARVEVLEVVGKDRLPTLRDRKSLPYCTALDTTPQLSLTRFFSIDSGTYIE